MQAIFLIKQSNGLLKRSMEKKLTKIDVFIAIQGITGMILAMIEVFSIKILEDLTYPVNRMNYISTIYYIFKKPLTAMEI